MLKDLLSRELLLQNWPSRQNLNPPRELAEDLLQTSSNVLKIYTFFIISNIVLFDGGTSGFFSIFLPLFITYL